MILHGGIKLRQMAKGSIGFICLVLAWIFALELVDAVTPVDLNSNSSPPVTMLGLTVAFFPGFKNTSTYGRWVEARKIWGDLVNASRDWANTIGNMVQNDGTPLPADIRRELLERHVSWLNLLAFQLRKPLKNGRPKSPWMFGHKPVTDKAAMHQDPACWRDKLLPGDEARLDGTANPAAQLMYLQGERIGQLAQDGKIDAYWHVALMDRLSRFTDAQGQSERIKNTPFPRQVADVGRIFIYIFIFLLPLAFNDERSITIGKNFPLMQAVFLDWLVFAPIGALVCWIFFVTERVNTSMEDPFEGDVTDVPISTICRTIEIDLRQMTNCGTAPQSAQPIDKAVL